MKLKLCLLIAGLALVVSTYTILRRPTRSPAENGVPPDRQLPTVLSSYSQTFKLNPSPPLWRQPSHANSTN